MIVYGLHAKGSVRSAVTLPPVKGLVMVQATTVASMAGVASTAAVSITAVSTTT